MLLDDRVETLALLSEEKAIRQNFAAANFRWYRRWLVLFFLYSFSAISIFFVFDLLVELGLNGEWETPFEFITLILTEVGVMEWVGRCLEVANLILIFWLFIFRERKQSIKYFNQIMLTYLAIQFAIIAFDTEDLFSTNGIALTYFIFILPFLRVRASENIMLHGSIVFALILDTILTKNGTWTGTWVFGVLSFAASSVITVISKRRFLVDWRGFRSEHREALRFKQELEHAREIQLSMLPSAAPCMQHLEIAASSTPAHEVGGDYFDYFKLSDSQLAVVVGDVSGHGVASGLVLSGLRSCLYLLEDELPPPGQLLSDLNRVLKKTTEKKMFMTLVYTVIDAQARTMKLANAGHQPIVHYHHRSNSLKEVRLPALPLGGIKNAKFKEETLAFELGDVFLIYTDGLNEATNANDDDYTVDRLSARFLKSCIANRTADEIRLDLIDDVHTFMGDEQQRDDITIVIVKTHERETLV